LRLVDAWSGKEIWKEQLALGTRGALVDCDEVAVMQPDGRFLVRSLDDDQKRIDTRLEPDQNLESLQVLVSQQQYIAVVGRQTTAATTSSGTQIRAINPGTPVPLITGRVYAFDRSTGKTSWKTPAKIEQYGFYAAQPAESPVLIFLRQFIPKPKPRTPKRAYTAILCIDRRDGRVLVEKDDIPTTTYAFDIVADRSKATVAVSLPTKSFEIKLTDQPIPPEEAKKPTEKKAETAEKKTAKANPNDQLQQKEKEKEKAKQTADEKKAGKASEKAEKPKVIPIKKEQR